jgi:hypothetical protein
LQLQAKKKDRFADRPLCSSSLSTVSFKSEQILLEKSSKVKRPRTLEPSLLAEIVTARHDAATLGSIAAGNLRLLESREKKRAEFLTQQRALSTPDLIRQSGFGSYVRSLERQKRVLDAAHDDAQAGAGEAAQQPLGNNTESHSTFREEIDQNTGEIQRLRVVSRRGESVFEIYSEFAAINARAARFSAQSSAGRLLAAEKTPRGTQWRVSGCTRRKIAPKVAIMYSAKIKKAHFAGLMVCGSVWTCPPCAAKVSERRKNEIVAATDMHKEQGGGLYLVTLTASHKRDHDLVDWLKKFAAAKIKMRQWRAYQELKVATGYVGDIRALEVTYGDANGWHPHEHGLWLTEKALTARKIESMRSELFKLWHRACKAVGLPLPNRKNGVDVRWMESSAEYIAKFGREPRWGAGSELAKQHTKTGNLKSMTPFDLLRAYHEGSEDGHAHKRFGGLFVQFAKAFYNKRQIIWSDGLKQIFGIEQKTDEELAVEECEEAREIVKITPDQWKLVLHQKSDVRQVLLERAESGGHDAVVAYLQLLEHGYAGPLVAEDNSPIAAEELLLQSIFEATRSN